MSLIPNSETFQDSQPVTNSDVVNPVTPITTPVAVNPAPTVNRVSENVTEITTLNGKSAISVSLPSGIEAVLLKPTAKHVIAAERLANSSAHQGSGEFERNLILLSKIIYQLGGKTGDNCVSFEYLVEQDLSDLLVLNQASQYFFRTIPV